MEVGSKIKIVKVPGETLYQHFIGQVGKVAGFTESGRVKVDSFASPGMLILDSDQIEAVA